MKKKVILSLMGLVCFGFLFSYNLTSSTEGLKAENIEALAKGGAAPNGPGTACAHVDTGCCDWGDYEADGIWYY